jgi:nitroreductase
MKLIEAIENRWSPRAFSDRVIEPEFIRLLFEAARWAPSSRNEQPWSYMYAVKTDVRVFNRFIDCLNPGNQIWAKHAPLIMLSLAKKHFDYKSLQNRHALHDTGAANAYLVLQAAALGLQGHQMGGFDMEKTIKEFNIDAEKFEPVTFIAVGYVGNPDSLPENLAKSEKESSTRKETEQFIQQLTN